MRQQEKGAMLQGRWEVQIEPSVDTQFYPLEHHENEKGKWAKCVVSIDEVNRRLNKPTKPTSHNINLTALY